MRYIIKIIDIGAIIFSTFIGLFVIISFFVALNNLRILEFNDAIFDFISVNIGYINIILLMITPPLLLIGLALWIVFLIDIGKSERLIVKNHRAMLGILLFIFSFWMIPIYYFVAYRK